MSLKYGTHFFLLAIICLACFASAFNSDRVQDKKSEIKKPDEIPERGIHRPVLKALNHQRNYHENDKNKHNMPDHSVEPHKKRVKVLKRRHVRNRRDRYPELPTDILEIFSSKPVRRSVNSNDYAATYNNRQQQFWPFPSYPSWSFGPPDVFHNTFVPQGPQINNYYSDYFSSTMQNPWQQQGVIPWSFSAPPFLPVIYIPIYYPAPVPLNPIVPPTKPSVDSTVEDRFSFPEELPTVVGQRPNTTTGISLEIATPPRRPSRPLPPIQRPPSNLLAVGESKMVTQEFRPQALPEEMSLVTSGSSFVAPVSYNIAQAPPVGSNVSPCTWAIITCCESNRGVRQSQERCFDAVGCPGAFYDTNPCDGQLARAAEQSAQRFMNSG